ncbi:O-acetyl-ADP-ribose deacetylase [Corallococcus sp. H22C18031201]|uniref:O-acetyl-ADP-ribose deacetylase n=1 Tax=Citreicoccus inhibens TaxID=2849499 RepID=UPI000E70A60A|nr:O-acetyl-ADP-ribose deacetylase [Citreicoccus inhibens]MBU8898080.1 O-acetyl-ADP-ribose deacetylase [Citreicoccus inhibens]RJS17969.1 O-acetyl-ADP-ribose deacetylase [Corallococcus sp. H22C18031201]
MSTERLELLQRLELVRGDITKVTADAVVNAANSALSGGGGVDGAIHRAAGPGLLAECRTLGRCPPGEARITSGHRLPARYIIHTVGPVWEGGGRGESGVLARCYRSVFDLLAQRGWVTVAFPSISTGIFGFPIERASRIALREILGALERRPALERVTVVLFSDRDLAVYQHARDELASAAPPA